MGSLEFVFRMVAKLLCSSLCLFDVIVVLHAMDEKSFKDSLIGQ